MQEEKKTQITTADPAEVRLLAARLDVLQEWESLLIHWLAKDNQWLLRRCIGMLGERTEAEDAVQEISLKVIRSINGFEGRSSLKTWVCRIADNHCISLIRARTSRAMTEHLQFCISLSEAERYDAVLVDERESLAEQVQATLKGLTSINRQVLELRFFDELSIAQIAEALTVSQSAAKMRLYRAMNVFREKHCSDLAA